MPTPTDKSGVQRFLGMCQYLSKLCHNLSETVFPLRDLTKEDVPFLWSNNHENAFNSAKNLIASATALRYKWMHLKMRSVGHYCKMINLFALHHIPSTVGRRTMLKLRKSALQSSLAWISGTSTYTENAT